MAAGDEADLPSVQKAANAEFAHITWLDQVDSAGRDRDWLVPFRGGHPPDDIESRLMVKLPRGRRPIAGWLAAALAATSLAVGYHDVENRQCGAMWWEPSFEARTAGADQIECIGLAPKGHRFFANSSLMEDPTLAAELKDVEERIHRANERASKNSDHLVVVYLSELTPRNIEGYRSELQQLRGIAVAQEENDSDFPMVVRFANGGDGMRFGKEAAGAIAEIPYVTAVVGMSISKEGTRDAIRRLDEARLPMMGTVISATDLATKTSQYYHQVGPTNEREAEIAAHYAAARLEVEKAVIYYSGDPTDLYSEDLRAHFVEKFEGQGITVAEEPYRTAANSDGSDIGILGHDACDVGGDGIVVYAGRSEELSSFLDGMKSSCENRYPRLLAGDDATRFVLNGGLRNYPTLTLEYLSFASSLTWGSSCETAVERIAFFRRYSDMFGTACNDTRDGHAMLGYDAAQTVVQAVRLAGVESPTGDAVLRGIEKISDPLQTSLSGTSGRIGYGQTGDHRVPVNKAILLLRADDSGPPQRLLLCGYHDTAAPPPDTDACPLPTD